MTKTKTRKIPRSEKDIEQLENNRNQLLQGRRMEFHDTPSLLEEEGRSFLKRPELLPPALQEG